MKRLVGTLALLVAACATPADAGLVLEHLDGESTTLSAQEGIVIVNFWATWCGPCREELPELAGFARERDDVIVLAVNASEPEGRIRQYLDTLDFDLPVVVDPDGTIADHFGGIVAMPQTFVLGPDGEVASRHFGALDFADLDAAVAGA